MRLALVGWPVAHSKSPAMHRAALAELGLDGTYEVLPVPPGGLSGAVGALRDAKVDGFNITVPHKQAVRSYLDHEEPIATRIGAVNTVINLGGQWVGTNTDAEGFVRGLREASIDPAAPTLVLGAGGAARAVVAGLVDAGAAVQIAARRDAQARELASLGAEPRPWSDLEGCFERAEMVVQATSATLSDESAVPFVDSLPWSHVGSAVCVDLVYQPRPTRFIERAQTLGCTTQDGLPMLLHQGVLAFERWTGHPAPIAVMRAAL